MPLDLGPVMLDHLDTWWSQYRDRLDGLTDEEHLWSPVQPCSTATEVDGVWTIEDFDRGADPAPFTSIAWRMWHIAVDCLDSYSMRAFGTQAGPDDMVWVGTADAARERTDAAWAVFRSGFAGLDADGWAEPLGENFGPTFGVMPRLALALHAHAEVTHHGAEVALLRDLYRTR